LDNIQKLALDTTLSFSRHIFCKKNIIIIIIIIKDFRSDLAFLKARLAQFESNTQNNPDSTGGDLHLLVATKIRRLLCEYRLETLGMPDQVEKKWAPLLVGWLRNKNQTRAIVV
jgi:hypothetical protein